MSTLNINSWDLQLAAMFIEEADESWESSVQVPLQMGNPRLSQAANLDCETSARANVMIAYVEKVAHTSEPT